MEIIINERWNYQLIKNNDKYVLSVMCGTVGLYEIEVELSDKQIKEYTQKGKEYIEVLVGKIRSNPSNYISKYY